MNEASCDAHLAARRAEIECRKVSIREGRATVRWLTREFLDDQADGDTADLVGDVHALRNEIDDLDIAIETAAKRDSDVEAAGSWKTVTRNQLRR